MLGHKCLAGLPRYLLAENVKTNSNLPQIDDKTLGFKHKKYFSELNWGQI